MFDQKTPLESELNELFDIRTKKARREKIMFQEAMDTKKEINLLIHMFSQGIADLSVYLDEHEILEWDGRVKRLVYHHGARSLFIEGASNDILIRVRPYLNELVRKAKESCF